MNDTIDAVNVTHDYADASQLIQAQIDARSVTTNAVSVKSMVIINDLRC